MKSSRLLNYLGAIFIIILVFVIGFYFGYKNASAGQLSNSKVASSIKTLDQGTPIQQLTALQVEGVYWIKSGQDPICDPNHPVKGTFADSSGNYYTRDNPRYDRVKPDICFATEEFAKNSAGFTKKF